MLCEKCSQPIEQRTSEGLHKTSAVEAPGVGGRDTARSGADSSRGNLEGAAADAPHYQPPAKRCAIHGDGPVDMTEDAECDVCERTANPKCNWCGAGVYDTISLRTLPGGRGYECQECSLKDGKVISAARYLIHMADTNAPDDKGDEALRDLIALCREPRMADASDGELEHLRETTKADEAELVKLWALHDAVGKLIASQDNGILEHVNRVRPDIAWRDVRRTHRECTPHPLPEEKP